MSDSAILKNITISQGNRWYHWHTDDFPLPRAELETHSANMHMIPANAAIEKTLNNITAGQIVQIKGALIEAQAADGWHWRSSLSREDTGAGACEVVYVQAITVH
jgi:hypothetical protein